jgi:hypothetical protein
MVSSSVRIEKVMGATLLRSPIERMAVLHAAGACHMVWLVCGRSHKLCYPCWYTPFKTKLQ